LKKIHIVIFIIVTLFGHLVEAQDLFSKRSSSVKVFLTDVLQDKKDTRTIIAKYMYLPSNDTISMVQKEGVIRYMIDTLLKANSKLDRSKFEIFRYNDFTGVKKKFNTDDLKDILIVTLRNRAIIYFEFRQDA